MWPFRLFRTAQGDGTTSPTLVVHKCLLAPEQQKRRQATRRPPNPQDEADSQLAVTLCLHGGFFVLSFCDRCEPIRRDIYERSIQICDCSAAKQFQSANE